MKKPISIEVVEEGEERFMLLTYEDGTVIRRPVDDKKATRRPRLPVQRLSKDRTRKKQF
jgi:hypothetical protein